jgi:hypothetical protein
MRTAHSLLRLVSILLDLAQGALQFLLLGTRSSAALKAENIVLRKQLAHYLEREACYATSSYVIHFTGAPSFGEAQAESGKFQEERTKRSPSGLQGKQKKPHPACERASCSSVIQGAAGIKISAPGLGGILRDSAHPPQ